ncbi:hypothetical protein WHR41_08815 [Cladosporium halotolerans]|uniref:Uncharacterized protein n=1 Tax=Cladosporium halotolerans TaxID=1052096 RepID=A0AB34KHK8_9PEZI
MTSPAPTPRSSLPMRLLYTVGLPASFAGLAYCSPPTAALTPLLLSPTIIAAWKLRRLPHQDSGNTEVTAWTYLGTSILGPAIAGAIQLSLCHVFFKLLFGSHSQSYMRELQRVTVEGLSTEAIDVRRQMAWNPRYSLILVILSYVGASAVEEGLKYFALRFAVWRAQPKQEHEYLIYAAAAGLGFGTIENILVTYASVEKGEKSSMIALMLFERAIFSATGHTIMALLTSLQSIRRDSRGENLSMWRVLARPVGYHGTWNFILFSVSAWNGNVGWIHPTDVGSIVFALTSTVALQSRAAWDFWCQLKQLELRLCE